MLNHSEPRVARLNRPVSRLEKRDWQLWVIVSFTGIVASAGLLVILVGAAFRLEISVSRSVVIGLFVLLTLLNLYLLTKRLQLRRVRAPLFLTTLEFNAGSLHPQLRRRVPCQVRAPVPSGAPETVQPSDRWDQGLIATCMRFSFSDRHKKAPPDERGLPLTDD
jgi:hypothetical protein